jgi:Flp pilus assembly pilin Flp
MLKKLWNDESGFIVSAELVLIATIAVIGLIVGLSTVRDAVTSELADVAQAINDIDQSYSQVGKVGHSASVAGSQFLDGADFCDDGSGTADNACISTALQTAVADGSDDAGS